MALKDKKAKKQKRRPKKEQKPSYLGKVVILDGKRQIDRRTGLNRDIPAMGGAGGSQNLLATLAARPPISAQGPPIQTPDQFKLAEDIKGIRSEQASIKKEQAGIAEEIGIQAEERKRKERSDKGVARGPYKLKASGQELMTSEGEEPKSVFIPASPMPTENAAVPGKIRGKPGPKPKGQAAMTGGMQAGGEAQSIYEPALSAEGMPTSLVGDADATGAPQPPKI